MVSPQGTVWLGRVPWDSTYRHVYYEGMVSKSTIVSAFMTAQSTNYTFIREDSNIRVPYNADTLYGINYCMYQNDGMWFCCFVNTITYVNNNTSLLHLQEDVWHTWGGNVTFKACMVEREHVTSDALGQWRAPEPNIALEDCILSEQTFRDLTFDTVVVGTNAIPHLKSGVSGTIFDAHAESDFDGNDPVSGQYYGHLFSGLRYYGFTRSDASALRNFLNNLNKAGAAESIACMFIVPSSLITIGSGHVVSSYGDTYPDDSYAAYQVSALGYTPRNKKCLTYPYCYFVVTDYNGGIMELKYEDCNTWGDINLRFAQGLDATATLICTALQYQGQNVDYHHSIVLSQNPQCSWVYQAYQNWLAQNASIQTVKQNLNFLDLAVGVGMTAVGAVLFASGAGAPAGGALGALGLSTMEAAGVGLAAAGGSKILSGATSEASRMAQVDAQSKVPNHISGQSSSNSLLALDRNMGGYMRIGLQRESAERLDMFFDVFGYQVDRVKVPNLTGRPAWNYVKTVGANMTGNVPADKLSVINECLDKGITFWHNVNVGNYGLSNTL